MSITLLQQIRFELDRFQSLLLTASQLLSFPTGTKTLQFPAFPDPMGLQEKSHSEIPGSKLTFSSPGHIAACHVLHQRLSQVIHLVAYTTERYLKSIHKAH